MPDTLSPGTFPAALTERLRAIVGPRGIVDDVAEMRRYTIEWRDIYVGRVPLVMRPANTAEVSAVMKLCNESGVAVVPQGGNTGLVGGGVPHEQGNEILISLDRMNRVLSIDPVGYSMTVEAGCILKTIQDTAAEHDRLFPLSLAAEGSCSIGGNLSTNAGGVQVLHYGNARNLVLGLEVVLPDGRIWNGLRALKKDNTGYDLKHLFMGAEGTLGIITRAVLKLWPKPKDVATAWLAVRDPQAAVEILSGAHSASEDNVTSCELMSRQGLDFVLNHLPGTTDPLQQVYDWYLLLEWSSSRPRREGAAGMAEKMEAYLADCLERGQVLDATLAQTQAQAQAMWKLREGHSEGQKLEGPSIKHDISIPVARLPEFVDKGIAALKRVLPSCRPVPFGHVGDGNLHFNCQSPPGMDKATFFAHGETMSHAIYDLVTEFGGSISAEHGIGRLKIDELPLYRSAVELDTMRAIKRALDPKNLMNPGKVVRV